MSPSRLKMIKTDAQKSTEKIEKIANEVDYFINNFDKKNIVDGTKD